MQKEGRGEGVSALGGVGVRGVGWGWRGLVEWGRVMRRGFVVVVGRARECVLLWVVGTWMGYARDRRERGVAARLVCLYLGNVSLCVYIGKLVCVYI